MPKPLNESSNSNQSQTPYEFINRKSRFFYKFGSAAIAVGSLAIALSIAVPSFGSFVGDTVTSAFGISPATAAVTTTQPATVTSTNALPGSVAVSQNPEVTAFTANTAPASSPAVAARLS
jgi:hypothetical protein